MQVPLVSLAANEFVLWLWVLFLSLGSCSSCSVLIEQFCRGLQPLVAAHAIWKRLVINRQMSLIVYVSRSRLWTERGVFRWLPDRRAERTATHQNLAHKHLTKSLTNGLSSKQSVQRINFNIYFIYLWMPGILVFPNDWYMLFSRTKYSHYKLLREIKNCEPAERKLEKHLEKNNFCFGVPGNRPLIPGSWHTPGFNIHHHPSATAVEVENGSVASRWLKQKQQN